MKTDELREKYLDFFETKGCVRVGSDMLVPSWDPSVLFTPAGMNQFKDHFLGRCRLEYTRATTCQKCLRTGDIDNVGRTAYHHTFFEMLGNFSFGDYFKREAIRWAWEFLTDKKWLGLDPDRLTTSVYLDDVEAAKIWANDVKLSPDRIERMGEDENFWPANAPSQGPDGVCGPCSEIYYVPDKGGKVEIWNLVFPQFNRVGNPPNNLRPLPSKNIDTGMGLERTAAVLQGVDTNFHIDILRPLVEAAGDVCSIPYEPESESGRRLRRIADHIRACTFAIHENVYPGPNKEKYVIKRLLRRAVLEGHQLGLTEPFLHKLVSKVAELMNEPYPELSQTVDRVSGVIQTEESNFFGTIDAGLDRIEKIFDAMKKDSRVMVGGPEVADMYTTHGFPPELFESLAADEGLTFDWEGYRREMKRHGIDSGGGFKGKLFTSGPIDALKKAMAGSEFLGYETLECKGKIVGIIAACDEGPDALHEKFDNKNTECVVVLDRSPFYGESGGQVGDSGLLVGEGVRFEVTDTQKDGDFILHVGWLREGSLRQGMTISAQVDPTRRQGIRRAHSATHILHYALQKHLGSHAQQQGSKVDCDLLRFDFTNPGATGADQLIRIEDEVNQMIVRADSVKWERMSLADARKVGAMMLFGEKYPDMVRVVIMGDFSKELCGGTHLDNAGQVGLLKIIGEESVSAGTRRITALTGKRALDHVHEQEETLAETADLLRVPAKEVPGRVAALAKEVRQLKKQLAEGAKTSSEISADKLLEDAFEIDGTTVIVAETPEMGPNSMRQLIDQLRKKASPVAVMLASRMAKDKVMLVAGLSRDLAGKRADAGQWIRPSAELVGGSGGGRADMAQAGGKKPDQIPAALEAARENIRKILSE